MKILHVIRYINISGGAERMVADIVKNNKNHFVICTTRPKKHSFSYDISPDKVIYKKSIWLVFFYLLSNRKKYNYFHLHLFPMVYLSLFFKKKTIIHEHNTWNRRRNFKIFRYIERHVYKSSSCVIAISEATKSSLQEWLGENNEAKILTVSNFTAFKINPNNKINNLNVKKIPFRVLMIGSFSKQKLQLDLVKLFKYLPSNFELTLIGDGETEYIKACETEMKKKT